ncbi:tape measure protein [Taylorella equigenitalis]|uniref:tape measure protein n=1 Tax=Taylorella equigenitalis TaxID=29575 RepID=UPI0023B16139|nr:tape measure protein [Taylorella equigenitalis]WEE00119.1 tape measure protein [Taylorella equigenitalis]WEE01596.1 tape measure protein [Taylorella equigenitalis]WFD78133.1 tape measure protein [Taylorella equigenitalis]WFD79611.1 tape measure protein [Taylorella equigenitalis]WFD81087.1 tape measure protein [Taylorella equigenitalis]
MKQIGGLSIGLSLNSASFINQIKKTNKFINGFNNKVNQAGESATKSLKKATSCVENLNNKFSLLVKLGGLGYLKNIVMSGISISDTYGQYTSRLQKAISETDNFKNIQNQLISTSNRVYKNYEDAIELFVRVNKSLNQVGYTAKETADFVSTLQFALTLDSVDAQKTSSIIDSISKSILTGKVQMEQFNSIVSYSPTLFQSLADSITKGNQQALNEMVSNGELTVDKLMQITGQMVDLGIKADEMPTTLNDAFTKLRNNFASYSSDLNNSYKLTDLLVNKLNILSNNLNVVATGALALTSGFIISKGLKKGLESYSSYIDKLNFIKNQVYKAKSDRLNALNLFKSHGRADKEFEVFKESHYRYIKALKDQTEATSKLYIVKKGLAKAVSFLGGPLGILNIAVTAGVMAWQYFTDKSRKAKKAVEDMLVPLDQVNEKLQSMGKYEREQLANTLKNEAETLKASLKSQFDDLSGTAAGTVGFVKSTKEIKLKILDMFKIDPKTKEEFTNQVTDIITNLERVELVPGVKVYKEKEINKVKNQLSELEKNYQRYFDLLERINATETFRSQRGENVKFINPITSSGMQKWD